MRNGIFLIGAVPAQNERKREMILNELNLIKIPLQHGRKRAPLRRGCGPTPVSSQRKWKRVGSGL